MTPRAADSVHRKITARHMQIVDTLNDLHGLTPSLNTRADLNELIERVRIFATEQHDAVDRRTA